MKLEPAYKSTFLHPRGQRAVTTALKRETTGSYDKIHRRNASRRVAFHLQQRAKIRRGPAAAKHTPRKLPSLWRLGRPPVGGCSGSIVSALHVPFIKWNVLHRQITFLKSSSFLTAGCHFCEPGLVMPSAFSERRTCSSPSARVSSFSDSAEM